VLDLGMRRNSDRAVIVKGDEQTSSKTMDAALGGVLDRGGFQELQILLPNHAPLLSIA
jgi:hypothetical protein